MIKRLLFTALMLFCVLSLPVSQLEAGIDEFPNTTFTDIDQNEHNLREYLAEGKIVIMAYWVASESSCIAKFPALEEIWQMHGPNGTNTTMLLGIEGAVETSDAAVQAVKTNGSATYPLINTVAGCSDKPNCGNPHYYVVCPDDGGTWSYVNQNLNGDQLVEHVNALIGGCAVFERDASVLDMQSFDNVICNDIVEPSFTLYNRGTDALTNVDIEVSMDGTLVNTYNWTGSLEQFETATVQIDAFAAPAETGVYNMTLRAVNPNGGGDQNEVNDSKEASLVVIAPELRDELTLFISPDFYPQEVQWELMNQDGIVLGHGEGYNGDFLETICVERGACYEFFLYDANADGIDTGHGELYQNGCEIFAFTSDDHDGLYTKFEFCLSAEFEECDDVPEDPGNGNQSTDVTDVVSNAFNVYPNPSTGMVQVNLSGLEGQLDAQVFDLSGQLVKGLNLTTGTTAVDLSDLNTGVYFIQIENTKGTFVQKLVLSK